MKFKMIVAIRVLFYFSLAVMFFLMLINFVKFPVISQESEVIKVEQQINMIENHREEKVFSSLNGDENEHLFPLFEWNKEFIFFQYISKEKSQVLPFIYLFIMFTFLIQSVLLAFSNYYKELIVHFGEKKLDNLFLYISEWAINSPPVLGVVGTIFAFGIVVSNMSDMSGLTTLFKENFADAALTTIIGGLVYVLNLFLNIFIVKNLSVKK